MKDSETSIIKRLCRYNSSCVTEDDDLSDGKPQKNVGYPLISLSLATKAEKEDIQFPMK